MDRVTSPNKLVTENCHPQGLMGKKRGMATVINSPDRVPPLKGNINSKSGALLLMNRTKKDGPVQVQGQEYDPLKKLMEGRYLKSAYCIRNRLQKKE